MLLIQVKQISVIEFHGNVGSFHCIGCNCSFGREDVEEEVLQNKVPFCTCGALIRPDIVFFGDPIPAQAITESHRLSSESDLFIAMGSSLLVHPAADLPLIATGSDAKLFIINRDQTPLDDVAYRCCNVALEEFSSAVFDLLKA